MNYTVFPSFHDYDEWFKKMVKKLRSTSHTVQIMNNEVLKVYNDKTKNFDDYLGVYWIVE